MLKDIYTKNSVEGAANKLGISIPWLYVLVDKYGIPRKGHPRKIEITGRKDALGKNKN